MIRAALAAPTLSAPDVPGVAQASPNIGPSTAAAISPGVPFTTGDWTSAAHRAPAGVRNTQSTSALRFLPALAGAFLAVSGCGGAQPITAATTCKEYIARSAGERHDAAVRISSETKGLSSRGNPMWGLSLDAACGSQPSMTIGQYFGRRGSQTVAAGNKGGSRSGGLFEAISPNSGGQSAASGIDKRIKAANTATKARPLDPAPWALLAALLFQRAGIDEITTAGRYTDEGQARLRLADQAWQRHLALAPEEPDVPTAKFMVQAYEVNGLNDLPMAVRAKKIVTDAASPPNSNLYAQLAELAYRAHDFRSADLAATRAVDLATQAEQPGLRSTLDGLRTQAVTQQPRATTTGGSP